MLTWNSIMWLTAMALPGLCSVAFASAKFPWPIIVPLLLIGPLLVSNSLLIQAIGESSDDAATAKTP